MIFNPIIVVAIIGQRFISKASPMAGAIAGYAITTGILLWGCSLYSEGLQIGFFGIPLSQSAFLVLCLVWYCFDTRELVAARAISRNSSHTSG